MDFPLSYSLKNYTPNSVFFKSFSLIYSGLYSAGYDICLYAVSVPVYINRVHWGTLRMNVLDWYRLDRLNQSVQIR